MNEQPFFSVVIPFKNAERTIRECLESIKRQSYESCEFIFVDNASNDRSPDIIREYIAQGTCRNLSCILEEKPGASPARNAGARIARGEWIVFTDSDCIITDTWLNEYEGAIRGDPSCAAFAGCIKPAATGNIVSKFLGLYTLPANREKRTFSKLELISGGFPTANFAVRKDVFTAIAGFDEDVLISGEDYELCYKIYRSGNYITSLTDAVIYHIHREDVKGLLKQAYGFGWAHAYCLRYLVKGALIVDIPFIKTVNIIPYCRIWIDINQLDKKILFLCFLGAVFPPLILLIPVYFFYITRKNYHRGVKRGLTITIPESAYMTYLLLMKSAFMGAGRLAGSFKYKVFCI
jgi:glycosyltransferase involved in cell wall biosynthesis